MVRPNEDVKFNWGNLWADLLKGAGRGLLEYDGSRAAQAAIAGLEAFDAAQERRQRSDGQESRNGPYQDTLLNLWRAMSPAEQAAFLGLPPQERGAWTAGGRSEPPRTPAPLPRASRPISVNPLDGWHLQSALPFGSDGRLKQPAYRR